MGPRADAARPGLRHLVAMSMLELRQVSKVYGQDADEPSGALDSANGQAVMRMIRTACQQGVAAVVVTHDARLASWADRVLLIRDGRIVDQTVAALRPETMLGQDR
jgi:ABC-type hemin transport system ATPase subunit